MGLDCLVCREVEGSIFVPGGFIWQNDTVVAFHKPPLDEDGNHRPYLGHLQVVTRRHVPRLGDLTDEESASVGRAAASLAHALTEAGGAEWIYSAVVGHGAPHFHLHLFPRYPGTPREIAWHAVDEWDGAPHGDSEQIVQLVERLKASLETAS